MSSDELEAVLHKDVNDLFADLGMAFLEGGAAIRGSPSRIDLVNAGRQRFEAIRGTLRTLICQEGVVAVAQASSSERELITVLADVLVGRLTGVALPIFTVAGLIAKIGITRFCRGVDGRRGAPERRP